MQKFADMGLDVAITELDVRLQEPENSTNLAMQSEVYKNTTGACVLLKACVGITIWDFYDTVSFAVVFPSLSTPSFGRLRLGEEEG